MTIYPFIREAIASAATKAQLPSLILPIANVGALYSPEEIEIPAPPASEGSATETSRA